MLKYNLEISKIKFHILIPVTSKRTSYITHLAFNTTRQDLTQKNLTPANNRIMRVIIFIVVAYWTHG